MLLNGGLHRIRDFIANEAIRDYRSLAAVVMDYNLRYVQLSGKKESIALLEISLADESVDRRLLLRLWDATASGLVYSTTSLSRGCILSISECKRDPRANDEHIVVRLCPERGAVRTLATPEGRLVSYGPQCNPEAQPAPYARAQELFEWSKSITSLQLSRLLAEQAVFVPSVSCYSLYLPAGHQVVDIVLHFDLCTLSLPLTDTNSRVPGVVNSRPPPSLQAKDDSKEGCSVRIEFPDYAAAQQLVLMLKNRNNKSKQYGYNNNNDHNGHNGHNHQARSGGSSSSSLLRPSLVSKELEGGGGENQPKAMPFGGSITATNITTTAAASTTSSANMTTVGASATSTATNTSSSTCTSVSATSVRRVFARSLIVTRTFGNKIACLKVTPSSRFLFEDVDSAVQIAESQCSQLWPIGNDHQDNDDGRDSDARAATSSGRKRGRVEPAERGRAEEECRGGAAMAIVPEDISWDQLVEVLCDLNKLKRLTGKRRRVRCSLRRVIFAFNDSAIGLGLGGLGSSQIMSQSQSQRTVIMTKLGHEPSESSNCTGVSQQPRETLQLQQSQQQQSRQLSGSTSSTSGRGGTIANASADHEEVISKSKLWKLLRIDRDHHHPSSATHDPYYRKTAAAAAADAKRTTTTASAASLPPPLRPCDITYFPAGFIFGPPPPPVTNTNPSSYSYTDDEIRPDHHSSISSKNGNGDHDNYLPCDRNGGENGDDGNRNIIAPIKNVTPFGSAGCAPVNATGTAGVAGAAATGAPDNGGIGQGSLREGEAAMRGGSEQPTTQLPPPPPPPPLPPSPYPYQFTPSSSQFLFSQMILSQSSSSSSSSSDKVENCIVMAAADDALTDIFAGISAARLAVDLSKAYNNNKEEEEVDKNGGTFTGGTDTAGAPPAPMYMYMDNNHHHPTADTITTVQGSSRSSSSSPSASAPVHNDPPPRIIATVTAAATAATTAKDPSSTANNNSNCSIISNNTSNRNSNTISGSGCCYSHAVSTLISGLKESARNAEEFNIVFRIDPVFDANGMLVATGCSALSLESIDI